MKPLITLLTAAITVANLSAQLPEPNPKPVSGARHPALSPDGRDLAFVYRGDIWRAKSSGGRARPLTYHLAYDAYPVFSPDGKWIAFGSIRNGNWDIFIMPSEGGTPRRLTWHSGNELPFGWSPDGQNISFSARRDSPNYAIYTVNAGTYKTELICEDYASMRYPRWSPDGKKIIYGRYGMPWYRPRYRGSAAAQIWLFDLKSKKRSKLLVDDQQFLFAQFMPDGKSVISVTTGEATPTLKHLNEKPSKFKDNKKRAPNLWISDLRGNRKQITHFKEDSVRYPTVAAKSGDIAFEHLDGLWRLKSGSSKPQRIQLLTNIDEKRNSKEIQKSTSGVTEAEPSPDGKTMMFGLNGDIWTVKSFKASGVEKSRDEIATQITTWAGDDSDFSWGLDGKKIYFTSDREGNNRIFEYDLERQIQRPLWKRDETIVRLRVSPDGKHLFFWAAGPEGGLYRLTLSDGKYKRILKLPGIHMRGRGGIDYEWSPDMKWIAYTTHTRNGSYNIWIISAEGGEPENITQLSAFHSQPTWSPDGKYLYFQSDRLGDGLYRVALLPDEFRTEDTDEKYVKPSKPVEVKIEFRGISERILKIASTNPSSDLTITKDGKIFFLSSGNIYRVSFNGREVKKINSDGGRVALRILSNGKSATFIKGGNMYIMKLEGSTEQKITFTADWVKDVFATRTAAFYKFWKTYHHRFYDANFHSRDWYTIRDKYLKRLRSVDTNEEFAVLLQMMVGELDASHSELKPASSSLPTVGTPHLGFTIDYEHKGTGLRVKDVPGRAPGSYKRTQINPGEYVLAIDGNSVSANETLYEMLNVKSAQFVEFSVNDKPEIKGARSVKYKLLSSSAWSKLQYSNWVDQTRLKVEKISNNRIGYIHLSAMGSSDQKKFESEAYEYIQDKQAMIFDVRFNRGGNIADTLIDWLERKPHGIYKSRDREPEIAPNRAWNKPIIVLMNEHSYSNGEMFPYAMRQRGLAKIVGMPTPGYVIWTSSFSLTDGSKARIPGRGVFRMDKTNMENNGEKPDVKIWMTPEEWLSGKDPQLDKAIEMLLHRSAKAAP
jgi:Tol biopolymer transport system component/C-terminal processing protease CtpA/Prc